jgi:hypothetical protein
MPADFARVSLRAVAPRSAAQQAMPTRQPRARRGGVPSRAETLARVGNADGIAQPEPQCAHGARHLCANGRVVCTRSSCARAVMRVRGRWDRSGGTMPEHAASDSSPLRTHRPAVCAAQWLHSASRCALRCAQRHTRPSFRTGVRPHACGCAHSPTLHLLRSRTGRSCRAFDAMPGAFEENAAGECAVVWNGPSLTRRALVCSELIIRLADAQ